jgi:SH3-like domain-containing protein
MAAVPEAGAAEAAPPPVETTAAIPDEPAEKPARTARGSSFVGGSAVNMRVGPSKDTATVTVLQPGEPLQVMEESEGWTYVATLAGETGWVSSRFLGNSAPAPKAMAPKSEERSNSTGSTIRVRGAVTVRAGPDTDSDRLFVVQPGERIRIAETRGNWARVILDSGISGWVRVRRN